MKNKSKTSPVIYTHIDNGAFWDRGFETRRRALRAGGRPSTPVPEPPTSMCVALYLESGPFDDSHHLVIHLISVAHYSVLLMGCPDHQKGHSFH